jgi:prepilin-type N-terminal cleavage/methylation domain-containing protein
MKKGFTLIELLVAVAIIGLLATIVIVNVNTARAKARDVKRIQDINELSKAIEIYFVQHDNPPGWCECYNSVGGTPPSGGSIWWGYSNCLNNYWSNDPSDWAYRLAAEGLLGKLPVDPLNKGWSVYSCESWESGFSDSTWYICANLEITNPPPGSISAGGFNYCIKGGCQACH